MTSGSSMSPADTTQQCPICGASIPRNPRYPEMLCGACMDRATDEAGRGLTFSNIDGTGGFQAEYSETGEPYLHHVCFVGGVRCCADEAYAGGIVIQPIKPAAEPRDA